MREAPYEAVKDRVAAEITRRKQTELFGAYIEGLKAGYNVKVELDFPDLPRIPVSVDDDPSIGPADAPITIVQFAEYQCPYCGKAGESVDQVMEKYGDKVRMVYRDFPLSFHPRAIPAIAANCAGEQDKYWEMHKLLMSNQRALEESDLTAHATTLTSTSRSGTPAAGPEAGRRGPEGLRGRTGCRRLGHPGVLHQRRDAVRRAAVQRFSASSSRTRAG